MATNKRSSKRTSNRQPLRQPSGAPVWVDLATAAEITGLTRALLERAAEARLLGRIFDNGWKYNRQELTTFLPSSKILGHPHVGHLPTRKGKAKPAGA